MSPVDLDLFSRLGLETDKGLAVLPSSPQPSEHVSDNGDLAVKTFVLYPLQNHRRLDVGTLLDQLIDDVFVRIKFGPSLRASLLTQAGTCEMFGHGLSIDL